MTYLERAKKYGHAKIAGEGKQQNIVYLAVNQSERFAYLEGQVRDKNGR